MTVVTKARLDAELVRRGLARSREHARELVDAGQVKVGGVLATKPATAVATTASVSVADASEKTYVSRGAYKLLGALDAFSDLIVAERRCLDAGASTGGFTQVLLERGARHVVAVDVGYGQLAWPLRNDVRVDVRERTNVRTLTADDIGGAVDLTVADLSFISLALVLPALANCTTRSGDLLLMVKPQFEVGREAVGRGGVVREQELRAEAVQSVATAAASFDLGVRGVVASPLPGPAGNVEYFLWLAFGAPELDPRDLATAIEVGPQ